MPKDKTTCAQIDCADARIPNSRFCFFHNFQTNRTKAGEKAFRKGDTWGGLLNHGAAFLANLAARELQQPDNINKARMFWEMRRLQQEQAEQAQQAQQQGYQAPAQTDPFAMLGLDHTTATEKDVREMQRAMAKPLHPDKNTSKAAEERLKEVNEAAAACIAELKKT